MDIGVQITTIIKWTLLSKYPPWLKGHWRTIMIKWTLMSK
jgi:hypothetical protein